jgi:hypothetical protein
MKVRFSSNIQPLKKLVLFAGCVKEEDKKEIHLNFYNNNN